MRNARPVQKSLTHFFTRWRLLFAILVVSSGAASFAQTPRADKAGGVETPVPTVRIDLDGHRYVGVRKCAGCHKKNLLGNQLAAWRKAPHARAFETLRNEESRAIATQLGLEQPADASPECLGCHVTAFGRPDSDFAYTVETSDGVQCESCHGPGRDYRKKKIMSDPERAHKKGLWDSDDPQICVHCHNAASPTFDPKRFTRPDGSHSAFDFEVARKQIPHPIPPKTKGHYLEIEKKLKAEGKKVE